MVEKTEEKKMNVVLLHLVNGLILIGALTDSVEVIELKDPYMLRINQEGKLEFIPYMVEFTADNIFTFNSSVVMNVNKPHEKYALKYEEIIKSEAQKQLLS